MKKKLIIAITVLMMMSVTLAGCTQNGGGNGVDDTNVDVSSTTESQDDEKPRFALTIPPDVFPAKPHLVYEFLGLEFDMPDALRQEAVDKNIIVDGDLIVNEDEERLDFANIAFMFMDDVFDGEITHIMYDTEWKSQAYTPYKLGVYHKSYLENNSIETITNLDTNEEIGTQGDYVYYVSTDTTTEIKNQDLFDKVSADFDVMTSSIETYQPEKLTSSDKFHVFARSKVDMENFGEFTATDVFGEEFTEEYFAQNELTLMNVMTTWCTACVEEIPHLQDLDNNMDNVGIMVFVLDTYDVANDVQDEEKIELSQVLVEKTGAEFPLIIPNETLMEGRLRGITSYPETFFVDSEGNIVGTTYIGAHDLDQWTDIVNGVLSGDEVEVDHDH